MKLKKIILLLFVILLSGCSALKVLESKTNFKNLNNVNGLYYKNNTLFTGEAYGYYENKTLKAKGNFKEGEFYGDYSFYYENGNLKSKMTFLDNKLQGEKTTYYDNNDLMLVENYKNGKLNGKLTEYYKGNKVKFTANFKDDNIVGDAITYDEVGNIINRTTYELDEDVE